MRDNSAVAFRCWSPSCDYFPLPAGRRRWWLNATCAHPLHALQLGATSELGIGVVHLRARAAAPRTWTPRAETTHRPVTAGGSRRRWGEQIVAEACGQRGARGESRCPGAGVAALRPRPRGAASPSVALPPPAQPGRWFLAERLGVVHEDADVGALPDEAVEASASTAFEEHGLESTSSAGAVFRRAAAGPQSRRAAPSSARSRPRGRGYLLGASARAGRLPIG